MANENCWIEIYEDTNFNDNSLRVHGPAEFRNMRGLPNSDGYDWGDQVGSVRTGPQTWVIAYADEDFQDTSIVIGPGSSLNDLGDMEDDIDSMKILDHAP